jgi:tetratricopeptide (TPR) repeat protein
MTLARERVLAAAKDFRQGRDEEAADEFADARRLWEAAGSWHGWTASSAGLCSVVVRGQLRPFPPRARLKLWQSFEKLGCDGPESLYWEAEAALDARAYRAVADTGMRTADLTDGNAAEQARRIALLLQERGRYRESLLVLDAMLARPTSLRALALSDRSVLKSLLGRPEEALSDARAALRLEPPVAAAYLSAGSLLMSLGDRDGALRLYREGVRRRPAADPDALWDQVAALSAD